jgi:hypothetical protein
VLTTSQTTELYVIPGDQVPSIATATYSNATRPTVGDDAEAVIAAIRQGRRVEAMTTLNNGNVVFAMGRQVGAIGNG